MDLKQVSTKDLFEELKGREGVTEIPVCPYVDYEIYVNADGDDEAYCLEDEGPASILVVMD